MVGGTLGEIRLIRYGRVRQDRGVLAGFSYLFLREEERGGEGGAHQLRREEGKRMKELGKGWREEREIEDENVGIRVEE